MLIIGVSFLILFVSLYLVIRNKDNRLRVGLSVVNLAWIIFLLFVYLGAISRVSILENSNVHLYPNTFAAGVLAYGKHMLSANFAAAVAAVSMLVLVVSPKK
jgi:multisubunit Na+/H+ antiporter MnhC subunit